MVRIEGGIVIGRPVEDVFDFVADERNEPLYNPRMIRAEKVTPGPVDKGPAGRPPSSRRTTPRHGHRADRLHQAHPPG
jgi:hypothetical protein